MSQKRVLEVSSNGRDSRRYRVKYVPKDGKVAREMSWTDFDDKQLMQLGCEYYGLTPESTNNKVKLKECLKRFLNTKPSSFFPVRLILNPNMTPAVAVCRRPPSVCRYPKCDQCVPTTRIFCSRFHNKCEFLCKEKSRFTATGDQMGIYLSSLILVESDGTVKNPLQPQLNALQIPCVPKFRNLEKLLTFYWPYRHILNAALGVKVDGTENKAQLDQKVRVKKFARMTNKKHKVIRLMDGHCGFLLNYLHQVKELHGVTFLNSLTIELVDIVASITKWHQKLYRCDSIRCLTEKIVDPSVAIPSTTLLYMNFCGVAKSWEEVCLFLKKHPTECLFSFSLARAAKSYEHSLIAHTSSKHCSWRVKKVKSDRKDYATFVVSLKEI